jgi:hypothetical protein
MSLEFGMRNRMVLSLLYVCCPPSTYWRFIVDSSRKANPFGTLHVVLSLPRDTAAMPISLMRNNWRPILIGILPESAPFSQYQDVEALFSCGITGGR